jgi:hypothetical protein
MEKQFDAENPLTLTLKGMDFLDFACLTKNFSTLQSRQFGRGTESRTIGTGFLPIHYSRYFNT